MQSKEEIMETLEIECIDATSLKDVLNMLVDICNEKGIHIESTWQDFVTSKPWFQAAKLIDKVASKVEV